MSSYCGGRFTVPPGFDFKILPQKSKNVAVVSIIGSLDSFNGKYSTQLVDDFLQKSPFSLPCANSVIKGYYDCERQLIFLHYRDSEKLLTDLLNTFEIVTYGNRLDPKYISLFKLLNRLRHSLYPTLEQLLRSLPLPRYCISIGRLMAPRLLFVFKLPPTIIARKIANDENALLDFEKNLSYEIFNVFYESGLLEGNSAENRLFDLMGYNYVRVLLPDGTESLGDLSESHGRFDKGDLAQKLLETLVLATGVTSLLEGLDLTKDRRVLPPTALYPPPGGPDDRSFSAFLQCHLTALFDDPFRGDHSDNYTPYTFELPTCKGWFTTCYKLYTSLFDGNESSPSPLLEDGTDPCLGRQWHQLFPFNEDSDATAVTLFSTQSQLDRRLSSTRCEIALTAAEAHYRQDLPVHYSRTFHLAKVVSSYNVFLRLARGPCVIPTLDRLTRRLARLYLAGRVGCPAVLVSGAVCRQELHTLPERFPGVAKALCLLESQPRADTANDSNDTASEPGGEESMAMRLIKQMKLALDAGALASGKTSLMKSRHVCDAIFSDCLQDVPLGLMGRWRYAWIEAAVEVIEKQKKHLHATDASTSGKVSSFHHLSVMPHRSDRRYISYCNCGRLQALRPDPFDYQEANWEFYNALELVCCNKVNGIPLAPLILSSSVHNFCTHLKEKSVEEIEQPNSPLKMTFSDLSQRNSCRAVQSYGEDDATAAHFTCESNLHQDSDIDESITSSNAPVPASNYTSTDSMSQLSARKLLTKTRRTKLNASNMSADYGEEEKEGVEDPNSGDAIASSLSDESFEAFDVAVKEKQCIPVTFFSGMPVLGQPIGTMPLYPSWAVHALGKYFSYSHSSGMALPGFLRGSHFLLPWDVQLSRPASLSGTPSKTRVGRPRDSDTVKLFLGFEMECPMGHRFFLAGPDRPMTGTMQGGDVRRSVSSLLSCDLPLYLPCRCSPTAGGAKAESTGTAGPEMMETLEEVDGKERESPGSSSGGDDGTTWAQLMRIYVAIPSVAIRVRFAPMVRPGPMDSNTPIFHLGPTLDQEIDANNANLKTSALHGSRTLSDGKPKTQISSGGDPGYVYLENGNIWVARLPFAYQDGDTIYRRPQDLKKISECCLIRGSLLVEEL
uniref:Nonsense-mediated mRNA decay factor SMG8 n=1 Tax=Echinococcus granulosus TaxID=6210 RepID=A0A068WY68_ECHGR|nr:protein of unknown function DUF2146 [Echinococcus granulosus]